MHKALEIHQQQTFSIAPGITTERAGTNPFISTGSASVTSIILVEAVKHTLAQEPLYLRELLQQRYNGRTDKGAVHNYWSSL
jgi:hypothetical protein